MKRAFPQKVKPVPSCVTESDVMMGQLRQAPQEGNRRVRTSAAVIGLAISMGAQSLLFSHQGDEAMAAEPIAIEPSATAVPSAFDVAVVTSNNGVAPDSEVTPANSDSSSGMIEHIVQEGQTLWHVAQFYKADAATVAAANGISLNAVLHVGQVLKVPADNRVASTANVSSAVDQSIGYYGSVGSDASVSAASTATNELAVEQDTALKAEQDAATERLKQKTTSLQLSLAQLKSNRQSTPQPELAEPIEPTSPEPAASTEPAEVMVQTEAAPLSGSSYQVVAGDTLGAIARNHGISMKQLVEANQLVDPNVLQVNQVLAIPHSATSTFTPPSTGVVIAKAEPALPSLPAAPNVPVITEITAQTRSSIPVITAGRPIPTISSKTKVAKPTLDTATKAQPQFEAKIASLPTNSDSERLSPDVPFSSPVVGTSSKDVEVATAPFVAPQTQSEGSEQNLRYNYVENLRLEIVNLRQKYQSEASQAQIDSQAGTRVATTSLSGNPTSSERAESAAVNPEFNPTGYTATLRTQVRKLQAKGQGGQPSVSAPALGTAQVAPPSNPQLVATAPLGSQNYEPLIPSAVGQMVSPDLPPLGSIDAYLPGSTGKFNGYIWPAKGVLTSGYGWRWGRMHKGIDIAAPIGTPVVAAAPGVVITAGWNSGGYGNLVEIKHPDGSVTLYAHNNRILVRQGQQVEQGQQIAEMGSTGYSTGPHSHFEVHMPGQGAVNPMAYLARAGA